MKRWIHFLIIYVLVHGADADQVRSYEGQAQPTITSTLASEGKTGDFITQAQYDAFIVANTPVPLTPTEILAALRGAATNELNTDPSANAKFIRAVLLTIIDENNLNRQWFEAFKAATASATSLATLKTGVAALPAMPDRTPAQAKTSVLNKITAGAAD